LWIANILITLQKRLQLGNGLIDVISSCELLTFW